MIAWSPAGIQPSMSARSVEAMTGPAAQRPAASVSQRSGRRHLLSAGPAIMLTGAEAPSRTSRFMPDKLLPY